MPDSGNDNDRTTKEAIFDDTQLFELLDLFNKNMQEQPKPIEPVGLKEAE